MTSSHAINCTLGYLDWHQMKDGRSCTGGLLVVDEEGFPQEFRCTEAIRPATVQSILYGESFRKYMFRQLIGQNLWDHLECQPKILLIREREFWTLQDELPVDIAYVAAAEQEGALVQVSDGDEDTDRFLIRTLRGREMTIAVKGDAIERSVNNRVLLEACANEMDIGEPFNRISAVLKALEDQPQPPRNSSPPQDAAKPHYRSPQRER